MTLTDALANANKIRDSFDAKVKEMARNATLRAVEKATEKTPPTMDDLKGTNTRTGQLKEHWATDSQIEPTKSAGSYVTVLANNMEYASYVNDGHRMDKHYVPGLMVNPFNGMLERVPPDAGGIVVGTKTTYVEGLFMTDAAKEEYQRVLKEESKRFFEEVHHGL